MKNEQRGEFGFFEVGLALKLPKIVRGQRMGWNFGVLVVDFDFRTVADSVLAPELRQFRTGAETPEEARSKDLIDAGSVAMDELGFQAIPADAPISFDDATSRDFDDYAVGVVGQKTVIVGRAVGLYQDSSKAIAGCERVSRERGAVFAFWFNDASDTHVFSVFSGGSRVRFRSSGPGLDDDEGAPVPGEPSDDCAPHDRQIRVLEAITGRSFGDLLELALERFDA